MCISNPDPITKFRFERINFFNRFPYPLVVPFENFQFSQKVKLPIRVTPFHLVRQFPRNERKSLQSSYPGHPGLPPQFRIFAEPAPRTSAYNTLVIHPAYATGSVWIGFCYVSRTINHADNGTSCMHRPDTKGGYDSEGRFLAIDN